MSVPTQSSPLSPTSDSVPPPPTADDDPRFKARQGLLNDILLWRRKGLNMTILSFTTALWVLLQVYRFSFITVASWAAMFVISCLFFSGNITRLFGKETLNFSGLEMDEQSTRRIANTLRECVEEGERWMFRVGAENDWYIFAGAITGLYLLSVVAQYFDFLTLLFIGVVTGLSVPMMYMKYENKITDVSKQLRMQFIRSCGMIKEKMRKIRQKKTGLHEENLKKNE